MTAQTDETPGEPAAAVDPHPTGSPTGHLEPEKALATWRAMQRQSQTRLDVGMVWAGKPALEDMRAEAARPPVHGERRWLATLLPHAAALATFEAFGGMPAAAWYPLADIHPRLLVWSYRQRDRPGALDVEAYEAEGLFGLPLSEMLIRGFGDQGAAVLGESACLPRTNWRRLDDHGVRLLLHRLAMFCMGDAVARPLRA